MGCRAISPRLVGLASELEGKPFHLIATDRQRGKKETQVAYMKKLGFRPDNPNFTLSSGGGHPKVRGNGYVPYYMVFDHHGKLARHHMCGAYHGGDGFGMVDWVTKLLKDAPPIYLGREPFTSTKDLADRIAWKKKLGAAVEELEKRAATGAEGAEGAELTRLQTAVTGWRDDRLAHAERLLGSKPSAVVPYLSGLSKELKRTKLVTPIDARLKELKGSRDLKDAIAIERALDKARSQVEKSDARTRKAAISSAKKKVGKAIEGKESLPIAKTAQRWLDGLK